MGDPLRVLQDRADLLRWLRYTARDEWQLMCDRGTRFVAPPEAGADLTGPALISHLVDAETARLRAAELYYVDAAALRRAVAQVAVMPEQDVLAPQDMPSRCGLLVWDGSISPTEGGTPVIAVSWGVRDDDTVWAAWWSDATAAADRWVRDGQLTQSAARAWLAQRGRLQYERERILPFTANREDPVALPAVFDTSVSDREAGREPIIRAMTRITIATWRIIADKQVTISHVQPGDAVVRRLSRAGLPAAVHAVQGSDS